MEWAKWYWVWQASTVSNIDILLFNSTDSTSHVRNRKELFFFQKLSKRRALNRCVCLCLFVCTQASKHPHLTPPRLSERKPLLRQRWSGLYGYRKGRSERGGGEDWVFWGWERERKGGWGGLLIYIHHRATAASSSHLKTASDCCLSPRSTFCPHVSRLRWWSQCTEVIDVCVTGCSQAEASLDKSSLIHPMLTHTNTCSALRRRILGRHITVWQIPVSPWKPSIRSGIVAPRQFQCTLSIGIDHGWQSGCTAMWL